MEKYLPDVYQKNIYAIDYKKLYKRNIKCLLFDLDNTLMSPLARNVNEKVVDLFEELKEIGFTIILFSNAIKIRVKPVAEKLDVDSIASARKPKAHYYNYIMKKYDLEESEIAMIGDQIMTDILGANGVGITSILVNPISNFEDIFTKFNRYRERKVIEKLEQNDLFKKGKYYD